MNPLAMLLVLCSCVTHAGWNLIAKRSSTTMAFFWIANLMVVLALTPVFWLCGGRRIVEVSAVIWIYLLATGFWLAAYYYCLTMAYARGDASVVYPLARASLLFIVPMAGLIQGQWPTSIANMGIFMTVGGCVFLPRTNFNFFTERVAWKGRASSAAWWAIGTAFVSSIYTLIDATAMKLVRPVIPGIQGALLYAYVEYASIVLWLTPAMVWGRFQEAAQLWKEKRSIMFTVGALDFITYLLVLWAYSLASNVAYVAAMRQFSTVLGVLGGILFLKEPSGPVRIFGSVIIVCGLALIALGR